RLSTFNVQLTGNHCELQDFSRANHSSPCRARANLGRARRCVVREPLLHGSFSSVSKSDSWFGRVVENLRQLLAPSRLSPPSANGAPIHVLKLSRTGRSSKAQTLSFLVHTAVIVAISLLAIREGRRPLLPSSLINTGPDRLFFPAPSNDFVSKPSLGRAGGG